MQRNAYCRCLGRLSVNHGIGNCPLSIIRLFKRATETAPPAYALPAGKRVYAIGDIHGRRDLLENLLRKIDADNAARDPAEVTLVFLGDLIDRGPDSCGVVDLLAQFRDAGPGVVFLMGNHEEILIRAAEGDRQSAGLFNRVGGRETMLSYGVSAEDYERCDLGDLAALINDHIPADHLAFMRGFSNMHQVGDYLFVHAGIRPGVALEDQRGSDLRWIRQGFLDHDGDHGVMVVHGHSISEMVEERANRIGIDTGAYASNRLTAIGLEGESRWYLEG